MKLISISFLILILASGCTSTGKPKFIEVHDEVILAPYALDYTYLRTLEAVQALPDWELDRTDKEKGILHLKNVRFSSFADADMRLATLQLKRVGPRETSVQFTEKTQSIVGGDEVLKAVKQYLGME